MTCHLIRGSLIMWVISFHVTFSNFRCFWSGVIECDQPILALSQKYGIYKTDRNGKPSRTTFERIGYDGTVSVVKCMLCILSFRWFLLVIWETETVTLCWLGRLLYWFTNDVEWQRGVLQTLSIRIWCLLI